MCGKNRGFHNIQRLLKHWDLALAGRNLLTEDMREPANPTIPGDYSIGRTEP